jgi:predicted metalloprotease
MKWQGLRKSENVEDRRRMSGPLLAGGGGAGVLILALIVMLLGGDPRMLLQNAGDIQPPAANPNEDKYVEFVTHVLGDMEDVWREIFPREFGKEYREPKLVIFSQSVDTGCGAASSATGPFYCPADETIYVDVSFFDVMDRKLGAGGDFAYAYVIAHEVGHHVQKQLGLTEMVDAQRRRVSEAEYNQLSVRLELQADFFAGVWAHHGQKKRRFLEEGDLEEALAAAAAIGDDTLQKRAQGHVRPESFKHGTSQQRYNWLFKGLRTGDVKQGDTFSATKL